MSDLYSELLVKKEPTIGTQMVKPAFIAGIVIFAVAGLLLNPLLWILAIALGVAAYVVIPRTDLEYEYLYVNGDMDIDVVMARMKRKRVASLKLSEVDLVAPLNSPRMDYYNSNTRMRTVDYSSGNSSHRRFAIITNDNKGVLRVIIEPDEHLEKNMKSSAPNKVFLD